MKSTQIAYIFFAFVAILMWNAFLAKRDDELYKSYYHQQSIENIKKSPYSEIK